MDIKIPYSGRFISLEIDRANLLSIAQPAEVAADNESGIMVEALRNPFQSETFSEFVDGAKNLLVIVNDTQRPNRTPFVLDSIKDFLIKKPVKFLVATGSHQETTKEEKEKIFGDCLKGNAGRIYDHISTDDSGMVYVGKTSRGTPVKFNRLLFDMDRVIMITTVEPHHFAGYTGGRKSFLPGISAYETIEQNHKFALLAGAESLKLDSNPINDDMYEALNFIKEKKIFSIQLVLDRRKKIYNAACGDIEKAFSQAVIEANKVFTAEVEEKADIVITAAYPPLDSTLYQADKALQHGKLILKEGGIIILVATCSEGIGQRNFYDLLCAESSPDELMARLSKAYRLGEHKSAKIASLLKKAQVWAVTDLAPEVLQKINIRQFQTLQSALDEALLQKGKTAGVFVLLDAGVTVPRLRAAGIH